MTWDGTAAEALVLRTVAAGRMGRHALRLALAELVLRGALQVTPSGRFVAVEDGPELPDSLVAARDLIAARGEKGMSQAEILRAVGGRWRSVDRWMDAEVVPPLAQRGLVMVWPGAVRRPEVALTPTGREVCDGLDAQLAVLRKRDGDAGSMAAAAAAAGAAVLLADHAWERLAELHALPDVLMGGMALPVGSLAEMHDTGGGFEVVLALLGAVFGAGG